MLQKYTSIIVQKIDQKENIVHPTFYVLSWCKRSASHWVGLYYEVWTSWMQWGDLALPVNIMLVFTWLVVLKEY